MKLTIEDLKKNNLILLECISGSKAYNLATKNSDTDIRGVYYLPKEHFYGFHYQPQISNESNDEIYYEIGRFFELLLNNNPTCLEMLATPKEFILYRSELLKDLSYHDFITEEVKHTFTGYAISQIKKAKGLNKKILQPMEKERKNVVDFCWIIQDGKSIPIKNWLEKHHYKQHYCGLCKIPHSKDLYTLYYTEKSTYRGIIKDENSNDIRLSEIPKLEKPLAYLYFKKDDYSSYCKKHKEYWEWMELRNDDRYTTHLLHGKNYDSKNMMHTIRLLKLVKELIETGKFNLYRTHDREELLAIKNGKYTYDEVLKLAEELAKEINRFAYSTHFKSPRNDHKIEQFLVELRIKLYEHNRKTT